MVRCKCDTSENCTRQQWCLQALNFAELSLWGPPLPRKKKSALGAFYEARDGALRRFSIQHYGLKKARHGDPMSSSNAPPQPQNRFWLRARPDDSSYAECECCRVRRVAVEQLIQKSAPKERVIKQRNKQVKHVQEMLAEREMIDELETEAHRSTKTVFCCDNKLGFHWQFLPIEQKDLALKKSAKPFKYIANVCRAIRTTGLGTSLASFRRCCTLVPNLAALPFATPYTGSLRLANSTAALSASSDKLTAGVTTSPG
eukprot:4951399-Pleurochrysis_carterae.AAC.1